LKLIHQIVSALFIVSILELICAGNSPKTKKSQVPIAVVIAVPISTATLILLFFALRILMKKKKARERDYGKLHFSLAMI